MAITAGTISTQERLSRAHAAVQLALDLYQSKHEHYCHMINSL